MERFDRFAKDYKETLDKSVGVFGDSSDYFAEYKTLCIAERAWFLQGMRDNLGEVT